MKLLNYLSKALVCALMATMFLGACSDDLKKILGEAAKEAAKMEEAAKQPQQPAQPVDPDASLFEKLGGYIDCINDTSNSARNSYNRYLEWVKKDKGPTCKERYISYGMYELSEDGVTTCNNAVTKGKTLQPSLPEVEAAGAEAASIFAKLQPLNNKAENYYESEDYKDDKCAFAQEAHPQLISMFDQFLAATAKLKKSMDKVKGEADLRQLALLEKMGGKNFQWQMKRMMIYSKKLIDPYPDGTDPTKVDKSEFLTALNEFEPIYKEFETFAQEKKAEIEALTWADGFVEATAELYKESKMLRREYEKKKVKAAKFNKLFESYNKTIQAAGRVSFD